MSLDTASAKHLQAFIERIERLEEEKQAIAGDQKEVYLEAKSTGFDVKIIRQIVRLRKQDPNTRSEEKAILDTYMHALGMTPLEEYVSREVAAEPQTSPAHDRAPVLEPA